jgi:hypothetical protein
MVNDILKAAGVLYPKDRFPKLPDKTCVVPFDEVDADGADEVNLFLRHAVTLEVYEPKPDPKAEAAIEAQLNARGLKWTKQSRYWLQSELRYQVIYEFSYIEKI